MPPQSAARRNGARILNFPELLPATRSDFGQPKTVLFIHGFTADARYMASLMRQFAGAGYKCLVYEYPSDRGIDVAADTLLGLLRAYDTHGLVSKEKLSLVGHSMGGLVARAFVSLSSGSPFVRKVVTLGTPHGGTLKSGALLRLFLGWGEHVSGLNPNAFSVKSRSALQLIESDGSPSYLERLRSSEVSALGVSFHSVSGGLGRLTFGRGMFRDLFANAYIQSNIASPNDGLVAELSSDVTSASEVNCGRESTHTSSYPEYDFTNHSYLVENQTVAMTAVSLVER